MNGSKHYDVIAYVPLSVLIYINIIKNSSEMKRSIDRGFYSVYTSSHYMILVQQIVSNSVEKYKGEKTYEKREN